MFTEDQLNLIKEIASKSKNQGELAVFDKLLEQNEYKATHWPYAGTIPETQMRVIEYCAQECKRQRSGEMSVYDMVNAWNWMTVEVRDYYPETQLTLEIISWLGTLVEPYDNAKGFRTIPIGIWDGYTWIEKAKWDRVPELLTTLIEAYYENRLGPKDWYKSNISSKIESAEDEFYLEYENIHPFVDGNGRTGKILYNYLKGTLDNPTLPPNFWNSSNP